MLSDIDATSMLAVKDLATARAFYEGVLGLDPHDDRAAGHGALSERQGLDRGV